MKGTGDEIRNKNSHFPVPPLKPLVSRNIFPVRTVPLLPVLKRGPSSLRLETEGFSKRHRRRTRLRSPVSSLRKVNSDRWVGVWEVHLLPENVFVPGTNLGPPKRTHTLEEVRRERENILSHRPSDGVSDPQYPTHSDPTDRSTTGPSKGHRILCLRDGSATNVTPTLLRGEHPNRPNKGECVWVGQSVSL